MTRSDILLAAALVSLPTAGFAQSIQPISITVPVDRQIVTYADLDLASTAGKRMLDRRISGAIEQVCGSFANVRAGSYYVSVIAPAYARWRVTVTPR